MRHITAALSAVAVVLFGSFPAYAGPVDIEEAPLGGGSAPAPIDPGTDWTPWLVAFGTALALVAVSAMLASTVVRHRRTAHA